MRHYALFFLLFVNLFLLLMFVPTTQAQAQTIPLVPRRPSIPLPQAQHQAKNVFPPGTCTWWANERHKQLSGSYVPWTNNANAWQWPDRASQSGWLVSAQPRVGSILVLQPHKQGAFDLGHVAIVEQLLSGNQVRTSNMGWGSTPTVKTMVIFTSGPNSGAIFLFPKSHS